MQQIVNLQSLQDLMTPGSQLYYAQFIKLRRPELKITARLGSVVKRHLIQRWHLS